MKLKAFVTRLGVNPPQNFKAYEALKENVHMMENYLMNYMKWVLWSVI